mmetsp:Transcript_4954/g.18633  ORF Transcript_4954/g.18633 Transcript_4954/m.18633 type:complete len:1855 (-) Transcript_4954:73-5637(-)
MISENIPNPTTSTSSLTKWNSSLPEFLHAPLEKEQVVYKEQIFTQLRRIQKESTKSNQLTTLLLSTLRLLFRYTFICHFQLTLAEKQQLVLILFDILVDENTEPAVQTKVAQHMSNLLKTKDPFDADFQVPWRPLWDLLHRYYFKSNNLLRYVPPPSHASNVRHLIGTIKKYFPVESVDEILCEVKPLLCVFDHMFCVGLGLMSLFLPATRRHPHEEALNLLMTYWEWNDANPAIDYYIISYLSHLAMDKCGHVDFSPYMDLIFTNTLRIFGLSVGSSVVSSYNTYPAPMCQFFALFRDIKSKNVGDVAKLLVWILRDVGDYSGDLLTTSGGEGQESSGSSASTTDSPRTAFDFLKQMFRSMGHFYHPSNVGRSTSTLYSFLFHLMHRFARRILWEKDVRNEQPEDSKLSQRFIDAFVTSMLPIARQSIFAKNPADARTAVHAVKHLCFAAPQICFPQLIELITNALTTLLHAHQAPAILGLLTVCFAPIFTQLDKYPEAIDYLPELLNMCLNGIDPNDMIKTGATCEFFNTVFSLVPFVRPSRGGTAPQVVHYYEEFCIQLLDRLFHLYKNASDSPSKDVQRFPYDEARALLYTMFTQMDDDLFELCSKRVLTFVEGHFVPVASNIVGVTVHVASKHPDRSVESLRPFMKFFYRRLVNEETKKLNPLTESEVTYYSTLLSSCLKMHPGIVGYREELREIMNAIFDYCISSEVKHAEVLLSSLIFFISFQALAMVYIKEGRSVPPAVWNSEAFKKAPHEFIGEMSSLEEAAPEWHEPTQQELDFAVSLWNEFSEKCISIFQQCIQDSKSVSGSKLQNSLQLFKYIFQGASVFMPEASTDTIKDYRKRMYRKNEQPITGDIRVPDDALKYNREAVGRIMRNLYTVVTRDSSKVDVKSVLLIGEALHTVMTRRYITMRDVGDSRKQIDRAKNSLYKSSNPKGRNKYPRVLQLKRLKYHFFSRLVLRDVKYPRLFDELLNVFQDMALSGFSKIRKTGQAMFSATLQTFNRNLFSDRMIPLLQKLSRRDVPEEQIKGICYLLKHGGILKRLFVGWNTLSELATNVVRVRVEKPSNQNLVASLFPRFAQNYKELKIYTDSDEQVYHSTVESLLKALNEMDHWREQSITIGALNLFVRSDKRIMFPVHGVLRIFEMLSNEMLTVRTAAASAMSLFFAQYRPHQKRKLVRTNGERLSGEDRRTINTTGTVDAVGSSKATTADSVEEAWKNITYLDKNYLGWECLPLEMETYDYSQGTQDLSNERIQSARSELVKGLLERQSELQTFSNRICLMPGLQFNATLTRMLKMFFQILGPAYSLDVCGNMLDTLLASDMIGTGKPEERSTCSQIAHLLGALLRASKHWTPAHVDTCTNLAKQTLSQLFPRMTPQCVGDYKQFFNFIVYDLDTRRVKWVLEWLFANVQQLPPNVSAVQESMWYRFIDCVLGEVSWRAPDMTRRYFDIAIDRMLGHQYDKIREEGAVFLAQSYRHEWQPKRESSNNGDSMRRVVAQRQKDPKFVQLPSLSLASTTPHTNVQYVSIEADDTRTCDPESFKRLEYQVTRILDKFYTAYKTHLKSPNQATTDESSKKLLQISRTYSMFVLLLIRTGFPTMITPFLNRIIDALVQVSFMASDVDLQDTVHRIFLHISTAIFPKSTSRHIILDIQKQVTYSHPEESATELIQHTSWRLKTQTLAVLQSIVFRHQFFLLDFAETLSSMLLTLMRDPSAEVKHLSMETLGGFMLISPEETKQALTKQFLEYHNTLKKTSKRKKKEINKDDLHYLILGLSAIILAHPYSVPGYLKPVLLLLSEYENVDAFGDKEIRNTFTNFWKTHQDEWDMKYAEMFTDDEKYQIKLSLSGSYFA